MSSLSIYILSMIFSNNYIETKELRKNGIRCGNNCKIHETVLVLNPKKSYTWKQYQNRC